MDDTVQVIPATVDIASEAVYTSNQEVVQNTKLVDQRLTGANVATGCKAYIREAMGYGRAAPTDPDAESLTAMLGAHMQQLTSDTVEHLLSVKRRMLTALETAVASEQDAGSSKLAAKQAEADLLKIEVQQLQKKLMSAELCIDRLATGISRKQQAVQDTKAVLVAYFTWRQHIARKRRLARQWLRAERYYIQEWLLSRAWHRWAGSARSHYKQLAAERAEQQRAAEKAELQAAHDQQVADLGGEIDALQQQLQLEVKARNKMEEEMKRAFMRGVTAINLEAVHMMRRGAPPSGANPFPVTVPLNTATAAAGLTSAMQQAEQQLPCQEQRHGETYMTTPVPAAAAGPGSDPEGTDLLGSNMRASGDADNSSSKQWSPERGSSNSTRPLVQFSDLTAANFGPDALMADITAPPHFKGFHSSKQSVGNVMVLPGTANNLPKVSVERGPAAQAVQRRAAGAATIGGVSRVAGTVSRTLAGRGVATTAGRAPTVAHAHQDRH